MRFSEGPLLVAKGLERAFGRLQVLRGIDLAVRAGEALAVFGPNGAGKTTLLRVLAGLMRPSAGEVHVMGQRITRDNDGARFPIGFLSHQPILYADLTLAENLEFAARLYGLPDPQAAARRALEAVDLVTHAASRAGRLSRGMVQRAAIARALVQEPSVLLLDEPFTGLDASAADRLTELLRTRRASGCALVVVTHKYEEAWALATQVAILVEGRWAVHQDRPADHDSFLARYQQVAGG